MVQRRAGEGACACGCQRLRPPVAKERRGRRSGCAACCVTMAHPLLPCSPTDRSTARDAALDHGEPAVPRRTSAGQEPSNIV